MNQKAAKSLRSFLAASRRPLDRSELRELKRAHDALPHRARGLARLTYVRVVEAAVYYDETRRLNAAAQLDGQRVRDRAMKLGDRLMGAMGSE